jgi:hypothetical protein
MPTICGEISGNIERNCDILPVGGVKPVMRLINHSDIASISYDATNPLIVTGITLKQGKKAFKYEVYKRGHKPRGTYVASATGPRYRHEVDSSIQTWDNASKLQVEALNSATVVAILENVQTTGDARIEIYGLDSGLEVADGAVRNLAENDGVYSYTLASNDESLEPHMPRSLWSATYAGTQTVLAGLDVAAV